MKYVEEIYNFRPGGIVDGCPTARVNVVTVDRGFWWFQKTYSTTARDVYKKDGYWFFSDTDQCCPRDFVDRAELEWRSCV